jgi:hypothetical protein
MPLISGPHYKALKQLTPKIFAGAGLASIDFSWIHQGEGIVAFTPIIKGDLQELEWDFGDESSHSNDELPIHDYGAT